MSNVSNKAGFIGINPLANPKGSKKLCELCEKPAYRQCKLCRVTFYCGKEHQDVDYRGIHQIICSQLIHIRSQDPILGSEEERLEQARLLEQRKQELLKISKQQAYKHLFEGQYELAIPAALQSLRFSMDISGENPIDLVPSYLILGESSVGMKQYNEAEDYLSMAKWAILKSQNGGDAIKSKLHRNFGQLYAAQEQYEKAIYQLSMDVYHCSLASNPEDITVTGGYYQMGNIFQKQGRIEDALAFFDKVVNIWTNAWQPTFQLDVAQAAEAIQMLTSIWKYRQKLNPNASMIRLIMFTLAKIHFSANQMDNALGMANQALDAFEAALGREHSTTIEVKTFIKTLNTASTRKR